MTDCIFLHDVENIEVGEWETEATDTGKLYQTCTIRVRRRSCTDPTHYFDTDIHLFRKEAQVKPALPKPVPYFPELTDDDERRLREKIAESKGLTKTELLFMFKEQMVRQDWKGLDDITMSGDWFIEVV